jgi:hypothetical protein
MVNLSSINDKLELEVILDNELFFKNCIAFLESSINKGFTFKIIPSKAILIGSNNSNER